MINQHLVFLEMQLQLLANIRIWFLNMEDGKVRRKIQKNTKNSLEKNGPHTNARPFGLKCHHTNFQKTTCPILFQKWVPTPHRICERKLSGSRVNKTCLSQISRVRPVSESHATRITNLLEAICNLLSNWSLTMIDSFN